MTGAAAPTARPGLVARALRWLEGEGYRIVPLQAAETAGLPFAEHGLREEDRNAGGALTDAAAISRVEMLAVLDPLAGRVLLRRAALPVLPLWEAVAAARPPARAPVECAVDATPATLAFTPVLRRWLEEGGARVHPLPEALVGAGSAPGLEPRALSLVRLLGERKEAWLRSLGGIPLVTADPLTLARHSSAVHLLDLVLAEL